MAIRRWLRAFRFPWASPARDVDAELRFHFDERVEELVAQGVAPRAALDRARREFGDSAAVRAELIDIDKRIAGRASRRDLAEAITDPFRFAARRLVRKPGFFALTAGSLAIALGATTAAIGFADAWKHPVLPFAEPDRTFRIAMWGGSDHLHGGFPPRDRWAYIRNSPAFAAAGFMWPKSVSLELGSETIRDGILVASTNFTAVAGVRLRLGRSFLPDATDDDAVLVSSYAWRRFYGDRDALDDASVTIDGRTYRVIGVMPDGAGSILSATAIRRMTTAEEAEVGWPIVRLKPGPSLEAVQAQLDATAKVINARGTDPSRPYGFSLSRLAPGGSRGLDAMHRTFTLAAWFILIIACANVSALLLARAASRRRDLALRLSLGARRGDIVADVLAELAVISVVGFAIGLVLATGATGWVRSLMPVEWTWNTYVELHWNWRVFAKAGGALLFVLFAAGLLPALQVSRIPPMEPLKDSSGGATGRQPQRMKSVVMLQLAMSLFMLICTSLLTKSVLQMSSTEFGYNPRMVTTATGNYVYRWNSERLGKLTATEFVLPRAAATKGVIATSWYARGRPEGSQIVSDDIARDLFPVLATQYTIAGPRFMETVGIPILEGRDFIAGDSVGTGAVILDELAATKLFPTGSAVGRRVKLGRYTSTTEPWRPVVGVVRNITTRFPAFPARDPSIYVATSQREAVGPMVSRSFAIVARAATVEDAALLPLRLRRELASVLPMGVLAQVKALSYDHEASIASQKRFANLFGSLAIGALIFAAAGLFAVLSYMVSNRMREFGVRVAIGATQTDVARLVLRDAMELALGGTAIGGAGGLAVTLVVWAPEFGVDGLSAAALVVSEVILIGVVLLAALAPTRRAVQADPVDVLRAS